MGADRSLEKNTRQSKLLPLKGDKSSRNAQHDNPLMQAINRLGSSGSLTTDAIALQQTPSLAPHSLLQLQQKYGNHYVQRVVQLARQGNGQTEVTSEVETAIERQRGKGRGLENSVQRQMETAFGNDFSAVRVHTDTEADSLNQALQARAFTTGKDIFFRQGEYNPGSYQGKELLAHELTHVVQQTVGVQRKLKVNQAGDPFEQEADRVAKQIMRMSELSLPNQVSEDEKNKLATKSLVQRQVDESNSVSVELESSIEIAPERLTEQSAKQTSDTVRNQHKSIVEDNEDYIDIGKEIAGFSAGLISGVFGTIWDTITGLWELGKGIFDAVKSILNGSLFTSISSIYNAVKNITWKDFKNMVDEVITMGKDAFNNFYYKWEKEPDLYEKWHFRGYTIGAIALEVVLAIFTGWVTLGAKVLAKIGKYFPHLKQVLDKLLTKADELKIRRRDKDKGRGDKSKDRNANRNHDKDDEKMSSNSAHSETADNLLGESDNSLSLGKELSKRIISEQEIQEMRTIVSELKNSIPSKVARDRNTVAVALVEIDGQRAFAFSINRNKFSRSTRSGQPHQINQKAEKLGVLRIDAEPRVRTSSKAERAKAGAPEDAEQLLLEGAEANNIKVIAIMPSRKACKACSSIVSQEKIILISPL